MIDLQNRLRNRGALNLFDGKGVKPAPKLKDKTTEADATRYFFSIHTAKWKLAQDKPAEVVCEGANRRNLPGHGAMGKVRK